MVTTLYRLLCYTDQKFNPVNPFGSSKMTETFEIIHSKRKTVAIQIKSDGRIVVRAPLRMSRADIMRLVEEKSGWIEKHLAELRRQGGSVEPALTSGQLRQLAEAVFPSGGRVLRAHHHPGSEEPLGLLLVQREPEFQLPADALPRGGAGLCCGP